MLTVDEAADRLRVGVSTLYRLVRHGRSPVRPRRIGGCLRFSSIEVDRYIAGDAE